MNYVKIIIKIIILIILKYIFFKKSCEMSSENFKERYNVDCKLSNWSNCVNGIRTRNIIQKPNNKGKPCGNLTENCNIDCKLSDWSNCDSDTGTQTRNIIQKPYNKGKPCENLIKPCDVDCQIKFDSGINIDKEVQYTGNIYKQAMNKGKPCGETVDNIGYISKTVFDEKNNCEIKYDIKNKIFINDNVVAIEGKVVGGNCKNNSPYSILGITKNNIQDIMRCEKNVYMDYNNVGSCINGLQKINGIHGFSEDKTCFEQGTQEILYKPCSKFNNSISTDYYKNKNNVSYYNSQNKELGISFVYDNSYPLKINNINEAFITTNDDKKLQINGFFTDYKGNKTGNINTKTNKFVLSNDGITLFNGTIDLI